MQSEEEKKHNDAANTHSEAAADNHSDTSQPEASQPPVEHITDPEPQELAEQLTEGIGTATTEPLTQRQPTENQSDILSDSESVNFSENKPEPAPEALAKEEEKEPQTTETPSTEQPSSPEEAPAAVAVEAEMNTPQELEEDDEDEDEVAESLVSPEAVDTKVLSETAADNDSESDDDDDDEDDDDEEEEDESSASKPVAAKEEEEIVVDYSKHSKEQLIEALKDILKEGKLIRQSKAIAAIRQAHRKLANQERADALNTFTESGSSADDFEYRQPKEDQLINDLFKKYSEQRKQMIDEREQRKQENLAQKKQMLKKLRDIVDAEETQDSIKAIQIIQEEWKKIGPVPASERRQLTTDYRSVINKFYSIRSIYYELKDLDRQKNLTAKLLICEQAEALATEPDLRKANRRFRSLYAEYRNLGPVPREERPALAARFRAASEQLLARTQTAVSRKDEEMEANLAIKNGMIEKAEQLAAFDSGSIDDWNSNLKEVLALKEEWQKIGAVPREQRKENRDRFWSAYKLFFKKKSEFFKQLDDSRKQNLERKQSLLDRTEEMLAMADMDWGGTAKTLKEIQKEWKEAGSIPRKNRKVEERFREITNSFFNKMREHFASQDKEQDENYKGKIAILEKMEAMAKEGTGDQSTLRELQKEFKALGFVPRKKIDEVSQRYREAVRNFAQQAREVSAEQRTKMILDAELGGVSKENPQFDKILQDRRRQSRQRISQLESDIAQWKNNMAFFKGNSKKAGAVQKDFEQKISKAEAEILDIRAQLKALTKAEKSQPEETATAPDTTSNSDEANG